MTYTNKQAKLCNSNQDSWINRLRESLRLFQCILSSDVAFTSSQWNLQQNDWATVWPISKKETILAAQPKWPTSSGAKSNYPLPLPFSFALQLAIGGRGEWIQGGLHLAWSQHMAELCGRRKGEKGQSFHVNRLSHHQAYRSFCLKTQATHLLGWATYWHLPTTGLAAAPTLKT